MHVPGSQATTCPPRAQFSPGLLLGERQAARGLALEGSHAWAQRLVVPWGVQELELAIERMNTFQAWEADAEAKRVLEAVGIKEAMFSTKVLRESRREERHTAAAHTACCCTPAHEAVYTVAQEWERWRCRWCRSRSCLAGSASAWRWRRRCLASPTSWCWTSPPTTWCAS